MSHSLLSPWAPIFVMSFNRPAYLRQVLESLKSQIDGHIDQRTIVMFQDGATNPYSGEQCGSEDDIERCVEMFQLFFPESQIFSSPVNLGVALNFDRAERYGFEELATDAVVFLEDDLVLGKYYFSIIDRLIEIFQKDERVGYVAAYGDHTKGIEDQNAHRPRLIGLTHNWGFALYRRQWLRMRPHILQYLNLVERVDYRYKDGQAIRDLFASWGYGCPAISQDAAKTIACCIDGVIKINTYVCNAKYVGSQGLHMNEKLYTERGYEKTQLYPVPVTDFLPLDAESYQVLLRDQRAWAGKPIPKRVTGPRKNAGDSGRENHVLRHDGNHDKTSSSAGTASQICLKLFGESVLYGYEPELTKDLQGWNSSHPIFQELIHHLRPHVIFDVGVWKGGSTIALANILKELGIDGVVLAIDTFLGSPEHWNPHRSDGMFANLRLRHGYPNLYWQFLSNVKHCECENLVVPLAQTSENAAVILKNHKINADLIHLDAAHEYEAVLRDALCYWDLLNPGGVFIGDDYHSSWPGVVRAATEFADRVESKLEVYLPKWVIRKPTQGVR
jgi:hypothetical protein